MIGSSFMRAGGGGTSRSPLWTVATSSGIELAALNAAIAVGTRTSADRPVPMMIADQRELSLRFTISRSWSGLKQMARMMVQTRSPTNGRSSCTHNAISEASRNSGKATFTIVPTPVLGVAWSDIITPGATDWPGRFVFHDELQNRRVVRSLF